MPNNDADFDRIKAEMVRLTAPDVLGFYTHFEATGIFAVRDGEHAPLNVLCIMVAEERAGAAETRPDYLGSRIRLKSLKGWMFGIRRFILPISELEQAFGRRPRRRQETGSGERPTSLQACQLRKPR
jgi:hypothetical protein